MRVYFGRCYFVLGLNLFVAFASALFSGNVSAGCIAAGSAGQNANCQEEGEAQGWVKDNTHQQLQCGSIHYKASSPVYSGTSTQRIATFQCHGINNPPESGFSTYIFATFTDDCTVRNLTSNARLSFAGSFPSCRANCSVDLNASNVTSSVSNSSYGVVTLTTGVFQYSGEVCASSSTPATTPDPPDAPSNPTEQCTQVGTLSQCLRTDGQMCATASNGTRLCWPANAPTNQTATDSSLAISNSNTPPTTPANAELSETVTNTTTVNNNGSTTGNTSIVNSYTTATTCPSGQTGTPPNCATTPTDGVVGGESCGSAPVCTGDALACYTASQIWHTRCALTKGVTGGGTCTTPYVCTGVDQVACQTLKELHKTRCAIEGETGGTGIPSARAMAGVTEDFDDSTADPSTLFQNYNVTTEGLESTGFLSSRSCPINQLPPFTIVGETFEFPSELMCNALAIMAALILLVGHIHAAMIVGRIGT